MNGKEFDESKCIGDCPNCVNNGICPYQEGNNCTLCMLHAQQEEILRQQEYEARRIEQMRLDALEEDRAETRRLYGRD